MLVYWRVMIGLPGCFQISLFDLSSTLGEVGGFGCVFFSPIPDVVFMGLEYVLPMSPH